MTDWTEIVEQHGDVVWRAAYRLLNNDSDASDCFQKVFLEAFPLASRESVRSWPAMLRRLATARALDLLRVRYRQTSRNDPATDVSALADSDLSPLQRAEASELAESLRRALAELPDRQAEVFCLCRLDGMSYADVADRLGLKANAVGAVLNRARRTLRNKLASLDPQREPQD